MLKFDADIPTPYESDEYNRALTRAEIEYVVERIGVVREAIGPQIGLAVDCHWNYNVADARRLMSALAPFDLLWFEDPVPPECIEALADLQTTGVPVATGENHYHVADFEALLTVARVRVLAPDVQKVGPLHAKEVGKLADRHAASVALHNIASPIGFLAAAHTAAAIPNLLALEWHGASVPFFDEIALEGAVIRNGVAPIPDRAGLGVTLNEEVARKYAKPGEGWFE